MTPLGEEMLEVIRGAVRDTKGRAFLSRRSAEKIAAALEMRFEITSRPAVPNAGCRHCMYAKGDSCHRHGSTWFHHEFEPK